MSINIKHLINQFVLPLWNQKALNIVDDFVSPFADIQTTFSTGFGPNVLKENVQKIFNIFSGFEYTIKEIIQHEDQIIYKWSGKGIHVAPVLNIQPSGKKITFSGIAAGTLQGNSLIRYHSFSDIPCALHTASNSLQIEEGPIHVSSEIEFITLKIKELTGKKLTKREIECLKLWLQGCSIKQTAKALGGLSSRTIQTFRENIKRKLNVDTYQQLFNLIYNKGLIPLFVTGSPA